MKIQVSAEIRKITPELATEWLQEPWGEQRHLRSNQVQKLATDMVAGRWRIAPDAILRIKGQTANGQHRLAAIVESGKAQSFLVMESNDPELYKIVDCGVKRTISDAMIGVPYSKGIPAIARWVMSYDSGSCSRTRAASQCEMINYCEDNKDILVKAATFSSPLYEKSRLLPLSIGGALYVIGDKQGLNGQSEEFLKQVYVDGGQTAAGDLRNRLISNKGSRAKISSEYTFGISLKALRSFVIGSRPGVLKWVKGEPLPGVTDK